MKHIIGIVVSIFSVGLNAQILESEKITKQMAVSQFGMTNDAHYIFCESNDCPQRTLKHLNIIEPKPTKSEQILPVPPISLESPGELQANKILVVNEQTKQKKVIKYKKKKKYVCK